MPGIYYTAQASHLTHLACKFESAVRKALALTTSDRHGLVAEALARRFPVDLMMSKYMQAWLQVVWRKSMDPGGGNWVAVSACFENTSSQPVPWSDQSDCCLHSTNQHTAGAPLAGVG